MIPRTLLAAAALATAGCAAPPPPPPGFEPITTPGQFVDRVAGRPITFPNGGVFVAEPGGSVGGDFDGVAPTGNWEFRDGQLCRTVTIGAQGFPEVCNRLEAKPGAIRFFNPDGTLSTEGTLG